MSGGRVFAVSVVHVSLILRIALKIASSPLVFMKVKIEGGRRSFRGQTVCIVQRLLARMQQ